jgi:hypothetical protein
MSTISEVQAFLAFLSEVFVEKEHCFPRSIPRATAEVENTRHVTVPVHSMSIVAPIPSPEPASVVASSG